jgi:hypothetical protein
MSKSGRDEVVRRVHPRYLKAPKTEKGQILDEFIATTAKHRKHAIRLLKHGRPAGQREQRCYWLVVERGRVERAWPSALSARAPSAAARHGDEGSWVKRLNGTHR